MGLELVDSGRYARPIDQISGNFIDLEGPNCPVRLQLKLEKTLFTADPVKHGVGGPA
jgi:hypothetical protein